MSKVIPFPKKLTGPFWCGAPMENPPQVRPRSVGAPRPSEVRPVLSVFPTVIVCDEEGQE
jgi:hypothetical protein